MLKISRYIITSIFLIGFFVYIPLTQMAFAQNHIKVSKPADKTITPTKKTVQKKKTTQSTLTQDQARLLYFLSDYGLLSGQSLLKKGKYADAANIFQTILKRNPRSIDALAGLGAAYLGLNDTKQAAAHLRKALARDNKHIGANYLMGLYYLETDKTDKAVEQAHVLHLLCARHGCPESASLNNAINTAKHEK